MPAPLPRERTADAEWPPGGVTQEENSSTALASVLAAGGTRLSQQLLSTEARLRDVAESHGDELARHAAGTLAAGGKRLRPMLVFLCAGDVGDAQPDEAGEARDDGDHLCAAAEAGEAGRGHARVAAAAAVELLHMATLVHDDVLDRAGLRRGRPTIFAEAGREAATATGDFLFSRAFAELAAEGGADAVAALSRASSSLARGELMQRADAWSEGVSRERYLERCELKTARLFEAACRLGSILGRPGPRAADALGSFGTRIGLAFQIFDDVLDVSGPTERTGKPRGTDLLDGTITLPLILARERDPDLAALDLRQIVTGAPQADAFCDRIARSGALGEAREQALHFVAEAKACLHDLPLSARQQDALNLVADGVVERYA